MYAVVGSTGQVGGAVIRALRAEGRKVRALLRDPAKAAPLEALGAETCVGSAEDHAYLQTAFKGVEGVFFMVPPLFHAPDPRSESRVILDAAVHALQASSIPKVVCLSSIGAQLTEGTGLILRVHDMEQALLPLAMPTAFIRAATFMDNIRMMLPHIRETGTWPTPLEQHDTPMQLIATEDIGTLAARLLTEPWEGKRILELEGPRPYSIHEAAAILSKALNRSIEVQTIPREQRIPMFQQFGMSPAAAAGMVEMEDGFDAGTITFEGGAVAEHVKGETTFEQWVEEALKIN